ncbi:tetratricopeptide repeat protein [Thermoplasma volcanium]|nr:tetratricopeptide repeat protein [Thermoplasma volcanium]
MNDYYDLLDRVKILIKLGRYKEALRIIDEVIEDSPDVSFLYYKISILFTCRRFEEAKSTLNTAISIFPGSTVFRIWKMVLALETKDVLSMAQINFNDNSVASSQLNAPFQSMDFNDNYAYTFSKSVRDLIMKLGKSAIYCDLQQLKEKILTERISTETINGLYTDIMDYRNRDIVELSSYGRAFYFYSIGRIGDSFIEISSLPDHEVFKAFILGKYSDFLKQTYEIADPYTRAVRFHILRLRELSLKEIETASYIGMDELVMSKRIIEFNGSSLSTQVVVNKVPESHL